MSAKSSEAEPPAGAKVEGNVQVGNGSLPSKTNEESPDNLAEGRGSQESKELESELSSEGSLGARTQLAVAKAKRRSLRKSSEGTPSGDHVGVRSSKNVQVRRRHRQRPPDENQKLSSFRRFIPPVPTFGDIEVKLLEHKLETEKQKVLTEKAKVESLEFKLELSEAENQELKSSSSSSHSDHRIIEDLRSQLQEGDERYLRLKNEMEKCRQENLELRSERSSEFSQDGGARKSMDVEDTETFKSPIPRAVGGRVDVMLTNTPAPNTSEEIQKEVKREKYCDGTPNVTKVASIIKDFKSSVILIKESQWEAYARKIKTVIAEQMWDEDLIDITKSWKPDVSETNKQRKNRVELYKVIVGTLGKEHTGKLENLEHMCDVNAVWKTLEKAFNEQYRSYNVKKIRQDFQTCTMADTGLAVVEYRIEFELRLKKLIDMGIPQHEGLEVIPLYLGGLANKFNSVVEYIRRAIREDETKFNTLRKVGQEVENNAAHMNLLTYKVKNAHNGLVQSTTTQLSATPGKVDKRKTMPCRYGINCSKSTCAFKHPEGWKAKLLVSSNGQATKETRKQNEFKGTCYKCQEKGHMARDCKKPKKTADVNSATVVVEALSTNVGRKQTPNDSQEMAVDWQVVAQFNTSLQRNSRSNEESSEDGISMHAWIHPSDSEDEGDRSNNRTHYSDSDSMPDLRESSDDSSSSDSEVEVVRVLSPCCGEKDENDADVESDAETVPYKSEEDSSGNDVENEADVDSDAETLPYASEDDLSRDNFQEKADVNSEANERIPLNDLQEAVTRWETKHEVLKTSMTVMFENWATARTPADNAMWEAEGEVLKMTTDVLVKEWKYLKEQIRLAELDGEEIIMNLPGKFYQPPPKTTPKVKKIADVYFRSRIDWFRAKSKSSNPGRTARNRMRKLKEEKDRYNFCNKLKSVNESIIMIGKWMVQEKDRIFNEIIQKSLAQTLIQEAVTKVNLNQRVEKDDSGVFDTGAMVNSVDNSTLKRQLQNCKKVTNMSLRGLNDDGVDIKMKGSWDIKTTADTCVRLKNTYDVPKSHYNLISIGQLDGFGCVSVFGNGQAWIKDKSGKTIMYGELVNGLYRVRDIPKNVVQGNTHVTNYDTSFILRRHEALDHKPFAYVRMVENLPPASRDCLDPVCKPCLYAQMKNKKVHVEALSIAPRPFFRLCCDTSRKMPATTVDGRSGIQRFFLDVDEFTGTMNVEFGQRKSDCAEQLTTRIDKLNTRCSPQRVAEVQSDGGTEYVGEPTLAKLRKRGITSRNSSPYCQYQNGVAENAMGKIQRGMKAAMFRGHAPATDWPYALRHTVYLNDILPGASSKLSHYERRTGLAPRETPSKIEGVIFCYAMAKLYTKGKLERQAIACIYLGKDPSSPASLVRVIGGKMSGTQIRRAEITKFDITNFPYCNPMVPRPHANDSVIYDSDSENDAGHTVTKGGLKNASRNTVVKEVKKDERHDEESSESDSEEEETPNVEKTDSWVPDGKIGQTEAYEIEAIVGCRKRRKNGRSNRQYEIKWKGDYPNTWRWARQVNAPEAIQIFRDSQTNELEVDQGIQIIDNLVVMTALPSGDKMPVNTEEVGLNPYKQLFDPKKQERHKDPRGYQAMLKHEHAEHFMKASGKEKAENMKWKAYVEVLRDSVPKGIRVLKPVTVYTTKYNEKGEIEKFKVRVCLDGSRTDVDPDETYAAICSFPTFRMILAMIARYDLEMVQTDVKNFYLQAKLPEGVEYYAEIPDGWAENDPKTHVAKVLAPWYGLREAAKISYDQFAEVLKDCGMEENPWLPKTFFKWKNDDEFIIMGQHSDDAIFGGTSLEVINETLDQIEKKFQLVRNYSPTKILGCTVERERGRGLLKIHQGEYNRAKLKELGKNNGKPAKSPGYIPQKIDNPDVVKEKVQATVEEIRTFQRRVGIHSWGMQADPSVAFAINQLSSVQLNPQKDDWEKLSRIERYKDTYPEMGPIYRRANPPEKLKKGMDMGCLTYYADADLAGCKDSSKSTSGYCSFLGDTGIWDWKSKKDSVISQSSCESETRANKIATISVIHMREALAYMSFTFSRPTPVCQDNASAIALCKNDKHHSRTRHFRMTTHFLKNCFMRRVTCYPWVPTKYMKGDLFNKLHPPAKHQELLEHNQISPRPLAEQPEHIEPARIFGWKEVVAQEKELARLAKENM